VIAEDLDVTTDNVRDMNARVSGRDNSFNASVATFIREIEAPVLTEVADRQRDSRDSPPKSEFGPPFGGLGGRSSDFKSNNHGKSPALRSRIFVCAIRNLIGGREG
jgi:hypothetical protein